MKRLITGAIALLLSIAASATTLNPVQLLNPAGSTSGQAPVSTGPTTAPTWGNVPATALAAQAANTVVANVTGSSASPTAFAMPSCTGAANALGYTSGTGIICNGSINAATLSGNAIGTSGTSVPLLSGANTWGGAQTFSSTLIPSQTNGIVGTTTNNNANAGSIGEFICAQVWNGGSPSGCATNSSTPIALTSLTAANVTSISLTAGDWDIWGNIAFVNGGPTVQTSAIGAIDTTSAALPTIPNGGAEVYIPATFTTGQGPILPVGMVRVSISATTTFFLVAQSTFSTSTCSVYGFIGARRRR